jgi:hypothetical protein
MQLSFRVEIMFNVRRRNCYKIVVASQHLKIMVLRSEIRYLGSECTIGKNEARAKKLRRLMNRSRCAKGNREDTWIVLETAESAIIDGI